MILVRNLLLLTLFLTPLIGATKNFGYEQTKVLFFILSISLIGFLNIKAKIKWSPIAKVGGIFIIVLGLTSLSGLNSKASLLGVYPYFQGLILYAYLFLFFLIVSVIKIKIEHWAYILTGSAGLVGVLGIKDWLLLNIFHQPVSTYAGRVVSTFGQPNFSAGFLLLTLPFSYLLLQKSRWRFFGWTGGMISLIGILISYSRSAIILALILVILGLIGQLKIKKLLWVVSTVLVLVIFLSINYSSGFVWREFLEPITTSNPDLTQESVENRVYIWPVAWQIFLQKPWVGYGLENIQVSFANYFQTFKHLLFEENLKISPVLISLKELNIDRTHNYILDLMLFSGLLGMLGWLGLVILLIKTSYKTFLIIPLLTYLIWIQFQNQSVVHLIYFWFLAGVIDKTS